MLNGCSENTKTALLDSMYVFLKRPEFSKYTNELGSVSPRILLSGPPGKLPFPTLNFFFVRKVSQYYLPQDNSTWQLLLSSAVLYRAFTCIYVYLS